MSRSKRLWLLFITTAIASSAIAICVVAPRAQRTIEATISIPREDDVTAISAALVESKLLGVAATAEFAIPRDYISVILSALTPPKRLEQNQQLAGWTYAKLRISTKQGRTVVVTLFEGGDNPATFAVDGVQYVRGGDYKPNFILDQNEERYLDESAAFLQILRAIHYKNVNGRSDGEGIQEYVDALKRSRGELPPRRE